MKRHLHYPIAALVLTFAPAAFAEDWVILDSTSPDVKAGTISPGDGVIMLAANTEITLIGPSGETVVVAGPYTGAINAANHQSRHSGASGTSGNAPVGDFPSLDPDYYK